MRIKLTHNKPAGSKRCEDRYALVDAEDYRKLSEYDWQDVENKSGNHYAARIECGRIVYMHRQIMNASKGSIIDHKDRNGLNNTKSKLRLATSAQNTRNCRKTTKLTSSKYKGVTLSKRAKKWQANICYNGIHKNLGLFENEEDAAKAYDAAAQIYHKEFAVLNFPNDS